MEADDPKQAAMKVFALHDTMTPEDYEVVALPGLATASVLLEHEDKDEAPRAYAAGEYFEEVDISEVRPG